MCSLADVDDRQLRRLHRMLAQGEVTAMPADRPCKGCGNCCGEVIPVKAGELEALRAAAAEKKIKRRRDRMCPFLTKHGECAVYDERPMICRLYDCRKHADGEMGNVAVGLALAGASPVNLNQELFQPATAASANRRQR